MLTGTFRTSYMSVFTPTAMDDKSEPKYSVTMLIPKSDTTTITAMQAEIEKAKTDGVNKVFRGQMPQIMDLPIRDGDGVRRNGMPYGEEAKGHWVVKASSKSRPGVVDQQVQPIINPDDFVSGHYARATVGFFAYNAGSPGIGCYLINIQKVADGVPLTGRSTPQEDFSPVTDAGVGIPQQPQQPAYPPQYQVPQQPAPQQPQYQVPQQPAYSPQYQAPQQPTYQSPPPQQPPLNPSTGAPVYGGVMGLG